MYIYINTHMFTIYVHYTTLVKMAHPIDVFCWVHECKKTPCRSGLPLLLEYTSCRCLLSENVCASCHIILMSQQWWLMMPAVSWSFSWIALGYEIHGNTFFGSAPSTIFHSMFVGTDLSLQRDEPPMSMASWPDLWFVLGCHSRLFEVLHAAFGGDELFIITTIAIIFLLLLFSLRPSILRCSLVASKFLVCLKWDTC